MPPPPRRVLGVAVPPRPSIVVTEQVRGRHSHPGAEQPSLGITEPPPRPERGKAPPQLPPYRPEPPDRQSVVSASPEQHRAATLEASLKVPLLGVAAIIVALVGVGGGAALVGKFRNDDTSRHDAVLTDIRSSLERLSTCQRKQAQYLADQSEVVRRQQEIMGAMLCKLGARARGMRCDTIEFETPPLCAVGERCSTVWRADTEMPLTPVFSGCE